MATVVVVDDAAFMRLMLRDILVEAGHRVVAEGENGQDAIDLFQAYRPDVMTLDMVMPRKMGILAAEEILKLDPRARLIMVSSVGQEEVAKGALKLGVRAYLLKPFRPDQVKSCVADVLVL